jgi:hypothetical protein
MRGVLKGNTTFFKTPSSAFGTFSRKREKEKTENQNESGTIAYQ